VGRYGREAGEEGRGEVIDTVAGPVRGAVAGPVRSWRAVPYAAAPTGTSRFAAPQPPRPWTGVRAATDVGPICPQPAGMPMEDTLRTGADHLTVDLWAPRTAGARRPVLVWLHGGAYLMGAGSQAVYDGARLAALADAVVVTVNHRLGVLGFMDLSSLSVPDAQFTTNVGSRDQIAALEWVRENIAAFGGDPTNVTLFGESSGGASVTALMTAPAAAGLFHRAIAQSPPATAVYGQARAAEVARRLRERLALAPEDVGRLHRLPVDTVVRAATQVVGEVFDAAPGTLAAAPVVDGDVLPAHPIDVFTAGQQHPVPLIVGTTRSEANLFRWLRGPFLPTTVDQVSRMVTALTEQDPQIDPARIATILAGYPDRDRRRGALRLAGDAAFRMPAVWLAEAHHRRAPTWLYRFDHATPLLRLTGVGATHATDVPYVFDTFGAMPKDPSLLLGGRRGARKVAGRVQRRWAAFARTGRADRVAGLVEWPRYDAARAGLQIGRRDRVAFDVDAELRRVWGPAPIGFR